MDRKAVPACRVVFQSMASGPPLSSGGSFGGSSETIGDRKADMVSIRAGVQYRVTAQWRDPVVHLAAEGTLAHQAILLAIVRSARFDVTK
jgi:hypothetical protein